MKITPRCHYNLEIKPENDAERIWLHEFLDEFNSTRGGGRKDMITVDYESKEGAYLDDYLYDQDPMDIKSVWINAIPI